MINKLKEIIQRYDEVTALLGQNEIASNPTKYNELAKEHHELKPIAKKGEKFIESINELNEYEEIIKENDEDLKSIALEEIDSLRIKTNKLEEEIKVLLLPKDPLDKKNTIMEIRAGTGGEEAALFAANLFRMYQRFAEQQNWKFEYFNISETGIGGFKEASANIRGKNVFAKLKGSAFLDVR